GQWRGDVKPKADEQCHRLYSDGQVALDTLELAGMPVEPSHESGFPHIGTVRREHRRDRRLDHRRFRDPALRRERGDLLVLAWREVDVEARLHRPSHMPGIIS